ncbi:hypothetical protein ACVWY0_004297 [Arthrobacter sp. UYNi723]
MQDFRRLRRHITIDCSVTALLRSHKGRYGAILELPDGRRVLRFEGLDTSDGPDLRVWLSDAPVIEGTAGWHVFDDGAYLDLGLLKANKGDQNYEIPPGTVLGDYSSVSIWCARFAVSFAAAELKI